MSLVLLLLLAVPVRSWDQHGKLTAAALAGAPEAAGDVLAETLEDYLAPRTVAQFLKDHKLNPATKFGFQAGETAGKPVAARAVLAKYADEPDWDMDQDLFAHYPELWRPEYQFMGGKTGSQTRAFRHMHWPAGFWRGPPPVFDKRPLGEAPQRAALFYSLAAEARAKARPYWAARFLAWAFHYVQDVTQPFHASQLPSAKLVRMKPDGSLDLEATTRNVIYFHLALDAAPWRMEAGRADAAAAGGAEPPMKNVEQAVKALAVGAEAEAVDTGETLHAFFPRATDADLADPVARVFSEAYWKDVEQGDPVAREASIQLFEDLIRPAGAATRSCLSALNVEPVTGP